VYIFLKKKLIWYLHTWFSENKNIQTINLQSTEFFVSLFYKPLDTIAVTSLFTCRHFGNKSLFLEPCRLWEIIFLKLYWSQETSISKSLLTIGGCCSSNPIEFCLSFAKQQDN